MDFKRKYSTPPVILKGKNKATLPLFKDQNCKEEQRSLTVVLPELSALPAGPEPPLPVELHFTDCASW